MNPQVPADYYQKKYDSKRRLVSYWHQMREIIDRAPHSVLEVGIGSGFLARNLRALGYTLTTVDFDPALKPDYVASADHLPFEDASFDIVGAFEILEHMPYETSLTSLSELRRVSSRWVIISLPDIAHTYRFDIQMPFVGTFRKLFRTELFPHIVSPTKQHYWEVGLKKYPLSKIIRDMETLGLHLEKTYQVFENHRHRFFIFSKGAW